MMTTTQRAAKTNSASHATDAERLAEIAGRYGCDPSHFTEADGLFQRHLTFDLSLIHI